MKYVNANYQLKSSSEIPSFEEVVMYQAVTGKNYFTGEELPWYIRLASVQGLVTPYLVAGYYSTKGGYTADSSNTFVKKGQEVLEDAGLSSSAKYGTDGKSFKNLTRDEILNQLDGVTDKSTEIVNMIKKEKIGINVLGDELFDYYTGRPDVIALEVDNQIYIRKSSETLFSDIVHEGTHAIDYINRYGEEGKSIWKWEERAYINENEFQKAIGQIPDFSSIDEINVHIWSNYVNKIHNPYKN